VLSSRREVSCNDDQTLAIGVKLGITECLTALFKGCAEWCALSKCTLRLNTQTETVSKLYSNVIGQRIGLKFDSLNLGRSRRYSEIVVERPAPQTVRNEPRSNGSSVRPP